MYNHHDKTDIRTKDGTSLEKRFLGLVELVLEKSLKSLMI